MVHVVITLANCHSNHLHMIWHRNSDGHARLLVAYSLHYVVTEDGIGPPTLSSRGKQYVSRGAQSEESVDNTSGLRPFEQR